MTKKHGGDYADGVMFNTTDLSISQRLGKPENIERSETSAIGLRVFVKKDNGEISQANVSSSDLSEPALEELADNAVKMARLAPSDKDYILAPEELYPSDIPELELYDSYEPSPEWLLDNCQEAEEAALSVSGISNSEGADASYRKSNVQLAIMGKNGTSFSRFYKNSSFSISVCVLAGEGQKMERDYDFSSVRHKEDLDSPKSIGLSAAKKTLAKLNPRKIKSTTAPIVFDPRVGKSILSILTSSISGNSIVRKSSFLKESMGKKIFPENISIIDNPHIIRGLSSKPFDMEGVAGKELSIIKDGVLRSWLLDMRTAIKLGMTTTGHASRGLSSPPSPSASNVYMEAGKITPQELISDIKNGLYLTETFGMGINTVTGDYSQGAAGFWIENGEITYPVSEITIAGNLKDMFSNLTAANDLVFRYSKNTPTIRIENMTIAGV
ncbi:MAG: metallopeptidase TldD-related protein [Rickettsiales bacterium]